MSERWIDSIGFEMSERFEPPVRVSDYMNGVFEVNGEKIQPHQIKPQEQAFMFEYQVDAPKPRPPRKAVGLWAKLTLRNRRNRWEYEARLEAWRRSNGKDTYRLFIPRGVLTFVEHSIDGRATAEVQALMGADGKRFEIRKLGEME